jgi:hypothetical protein
MKRRLNKSTVIALLFLVLAGISSSQIVTLKFTGSVTDTSRSGGVAFDGSVSLGSAISGSLTWDTALLLNNKYPVSDLTLTVGNYTLNDIASSSNPTVFWQNTTDHDYMSQGSSIGFDGTIYDSGIAKHYDDIVWQSRYLYFQLWMNPFGPSMLEDISDITHFDRTSISVGMSEVDANYATRATFYIGGNITSLQLIPEPATIILFGAAIPFMLRRRRLHV